LLRVLTCRWLCKPAEDASAAAASLESSGGTVGGGMIVVQHALDGSERTLEPEQLVSELLAPRFKGARLMPCRLAC
jgi:hypothetical protein